MGLLRRIPEWRARERKWKRRSERKGCVRVCLCLRRAWTNSKWQVDCSGDLMWWLFTRKLLFNESSEKKPPFRFYRRVYYSWLSVCVFPLVCHVIHQKCAGKTWNSGEQQMVPIVRQHPEDIETCFQKVWITFWIGHVIFFWRSSQRSLYWIQRRLKDLQAPL